MDPLFQQRDVVLSLPQCHLCGLYRGCNSPKMKPFGNKGSKVLVVGEAPGADEDEAGRPFVGRAGKRLRVLFNELGHDLEDFLVTNSIICRPPENKMDERYHQACRPVLHRLLREKRFDVVLTFGEWALAQVLPEEWKRYGGPIGKWRGWRIPISQFGTWVCPTYHPSYLVRSGDDLVLQKMVLEDVRRALRLEGVCPKGHSLDELRKRVALIWEEGDAKERLRELASKEGVVAFDYETTGLKPDLDCHRIVSCSFCFEGEEAWAFRVTDRLLPFIGDVLFSSDLRKVASNLKFEERWTRKTFGRGVVGWYWDTMLAAHCLDNRTGITSIKFQSFVRLGVGGWEQGVSQYLDSKTSNGVNRIDRLPTEKLLEYNALDSLLEFLVMKDQREEMHL